MRAILYTHDMEPITALDVPGEWQKFFFGEARSDVLSGDAAYTAYMQSV